MKIQIEEDSMEHMEQFKKVLDELCNIDDDFYAMGVLLTDLKKAYPIERNPGAYSAIHVFSDWIHTKKKQMEKIIDRLDDELVVMSNRNN